MGKADGRQARAIQGLAAALQECLDSAAESGARRVGEEIRSEVQSEVRSKFRSEIRDEFGPRFDRQDETLRLMWRQCGGDPDRRLPVDD